MFAACGPEAQRLNTQISYDDKICLSLERSESKHNFIIVAVITNLLSENFICVYDEI